MNSAMGKELRGLLPLWYVAAGLTLVLPLLGAMLSPHALLPLDLIPPVLLIAFCLVAAVVYTSEFEFNTLPLLLAQPVPRARIWIRKFASVALALSPLLLFYVLFVPLTLIGDVRASVARDWKVHSLVVLACACAVGYWSLVARNLLRAVALTLGSLVLWVSVADWIVETLASRGTIAAPAHNWHIPGAIALYATIFGWLGWRKFCSLELVEPLGADGSGRIDGHGSSEPALPRRKEQAPMKPDFVGAFLRKEARLHRPILLLGSGLFLGAWFVVALMFTLSHKSREDLVVALSLIATCYVGLSAILAGSVSLSEEARLGLFEWHLTLPLSRGKLWFWKLLSALGAALVVSVGVPAAAGALTAWTLWGADDVLQVTREMWPWVLGAIVLELSLASFWAATFLRDTVRATVGLVATLMLACSVLAFIGWLLSEAVGFQTVPLLWISAWRQQIPYSEHVSQTLRAIWMVTIPLVLGWQSYQGMRNNLHGIRAFLRKAAWLLGIILLLTVWSADLINSSRRVYVSFHQSEIYPAVVALGKLPAPEESIHVSPAELAATGKLSKLGRFWLRDSRITLKRRLLGRIQLLDVELKFPKGTSATFVLSWPRGRSARDLEEDLIIAPGSVSPPSR